MDEEVTNRKRRIASAQEAREWLLDYNYYRNGPIALMLIGIRDLKQINDREGRDAGDEAIRQTAGRIAGYLEISALEVGLFAKMPGREFLVLLKGDIPKSKLSDEARIMVDTLISLPKSGDGNIPVSVRIGLSKSKAGESGHELLHRTEAALSSAYAGKRERVAFAPSIKSDGKRHIQQLDMALRDAITAKEVSVMFQPQFEVASGALVGAEALARWHHEELGEIGANQLFASADRCDLREELSQHLQEQAIRAAAKWPAALNNLKLSVNMGPEELTAEFADQLADFLVETEFDAERLTLELTEESLVRDVDKAAEQLALLREKGITVALDDFGTGYSSLAYLKMLPLDYLKLDKGMTPDIMGEEKDRIVLRAIIAMGQALGLKIIAEGVETLEELEMLSAEGCDFYQGFLASPPLTPSEFEKFALRSN